MPEITSETPREAYTIAGETFQVPKPYAEGHVLSAGEAGALNQTFAENARNNFAKKVTEAKAAGSFELEVFQASLDDYLESYQFGVRTGGGGRSTDPVMAEAMSIAREKVRAALVKQGHKLKDIAAADITAHAKAALDKYPQILEMAKARVEAAKEITLDLTSDEPAPVAKAKKSAA